MEFPGDVWEQKIGIALFIILIMMKKKLIDLGKATKFPVYSASYGFSTDIVNVRLPLVDPATHKPTD